MAKSKLLRVSSAVAGAILVAAGVLLPWTCHGDVIYVCSSGTDIETEALQWIDPAATILAAIIVAVVGLIIRSISDNRIVRNDLPVWIIAFGTALFLVLQHVLIDHGGLALAFLGGLAAWIMLRCSDPRRPAKTSAAAALTILAAFSAYHLAAILWMQAAYAGYIGGPAFGFGLPLVVIGTFILSIGYWFYRKEPTGSVPEERP